MNAKKVTWNFSKYLATSVTLGDSHCKDFHHHFDPRGKGRPPFIWREMRRGLLPAAFHSKDNNRHRATCRHQQYGPVLSGIGVRALRNIFDVSHRDFPSIKMLYANLILPIL